MEKLTREECFRELVKNSRGQIYLSAGIDYYTSKRLIPLTPLGEVILKNRDPKEVYYELFEETISKLRYVSEERNQNH